VDPGDLGAPPQARAPGWPRGPTLLLDAFLLFLLAFLLSLLDPALLALRHDLLRQGCHRTGKRGPETPATPEPPAPLYRLRSALSRLWLAFPQSSLFADSG
jgi:hypothetical protein